MMGPRAIAFLVAAGALGALAAFGPPPAGPGGGTAASRRLLGPLARVASSIEWLRFTETLHRGDEERAYAIALRALELSPESAEGWSYLAYHFVFVRGSELEGAGPEERRRWVLAGLDLLREGRTRGAPAADLAFEEAAYALTLGSMDADLAPWPEARAELMPRARAALEEAARLGHRRALEALGDWYGDRGGDR